MTDNEIIIDGVAYYKQPVINKGLDEKHYITEYRLLATHYNLLLEDYARKSAECEELKKKAAQTNNEAMQKIKAFLEEWSSQDNRGMAFPYYYTIADEKERYEPYARGEYFLDSCCGEKKDGEE